MNEKTVGYGLLALGIFVIIASAFSVIMVFTGRTEPIQIFNFEGIGINASDLVAGLPQGVGGRSELVSADLLNETSNLFAHLFLMGFISTVGFKVASLGTMLVRPIVVKLKEEQNNSTVEKKI